MKMQCPKQVTPISIICFTIGALSILFSIISNIRREISISNALESKTYIRYDDKYTDDIIDIEKKSSNIYQLINNMNTSVYHNPTTEVQNEDAESIYRPTTPWKEKGLTSKMVFILKNVIPSSNTYEFRFLIWGILIIGIGVVIPYFILENYTQDTPIDYTIGSEQTTPTLPTVSANREDVYNIFTELPPNEITETKPAQDNSIFSRASNAVKKAIKAAVKRRELPDTAPVPTSNKTDCYTKEQWENIVIAHDQLSKNAGVAVDLEAPKKFC